MKPTPAEEFCKDLRSLIEGNPDSTEEWDQDKLLYAIDFFKGEGVEVEGIFLNEKLDEKSNHWSLLTGVKNSEINAWDPKWGKEPKYSKNLNLIVLTKACYENMRENGFEISDNSVNIDPGHIILYGHDDMKRSLATLEEMGYEKKLSDYKPTQKQKNTYDCALHCIYKAKESNEAN